MTASIFESIWALDSIGIIMLVVMLLHTLEIHCEIIYQYLLYLLLFETGNVFPARLGENKVFISLGYGTFMLI